MTIYDWSKYIIRKLNVCETHTESLYRCCNLWVFLNAVKEWKREIVRAVHCDVNCFDSGSTAMWLVHSEWNTEQQPSGTMSHSTPDKTAEGVEGGGGVGVGGAYKNIGARKSSHGLKGSVLGPCRTSYITVLNIKKILLKIQAGPSCTSRPEVDYFIPENWWCIHKDCSVLITGPFFTEYPVHTLNTAWLHSTDYNHTV